MPVKRNHANPKIVKERDGNRCQACGMRYIKNSHIEAHHIQPLWMGEEDNINNMVTLCVYCHKLAPDNPDDFYNYQRSGGAKWAAIARDALDKAPPDLTVSQIKECLENVKAMMYNFWVDANGDIIFSLEGED